MTKNLKTEIKVFIGYEYSFSGAPDARSWQKNRAELTDSECLGYNVNRSFQKFHKESIDEPCSNEYSPSPGSAVETEILTDFLNEITGYRRSFLMIINENGQARVQLQIVNFMLQLTIDFAIC